MMYECSGGVESPRGCVGFGYRPKGTCRPRAGRFNNGMPHRAFIGIGSNLGDRKANHLEAIDRIQKLPQTRVVKQSSLYESEPLGDAKTWFVNGAIEDETEVFADELL